MCLSLISRFCSIMWWGSCFLEKLRTKNSIFPTGFKARLLLSTERMMYYLLLLASRGPKYRYRWPRSARIWNCAAATLPVPSPPFCHLSPCACTFQHPGLCCSAHSIRGLCAASVLVFHQLPAKERVLLLHTLPVFVKARCFLCVSWINWHVQAFTEPWRCWIQLGTHCRALAHKVIKREHFSSQCYCRMAAGRKGWSIQLQHSQLASPQKNPVTDPLLYRRKTLLKLKTPSTALRLSSRFGPRDLLLLLPVFTCMPGL